MPIKLNNKPKTVQQLRDEYVQSKKAETERLDVVLRLLIDEHREEYQQYIAKGIIANVQNFLDNRKPGEDAYAYFKRLYGEANTRQYEAALRPLLSALTDCDTVEKQWNGRTAQYSDFTISFKRDYKSLAYKLAGKEVEQTVLTFVTRAQNKLVDVFVKHPNYVALLSNGGFRNGVIEGEIAIQVTRKDISKLTSFSLRLGLKWNYSKYGTPYVQYPFTFHDFWESSKFPASQNPSKADADKYIHGVSEQDILDLHDVTPWKPDPALTKKPKWTQVKAGCVVRWWKESDAGKESLLLVRRITKNKVLGGQHATGVLVDGETEVIRDVQIIEVVAEITITPGHEYERHQAPDTARVILPEGRLDFDFGFEDIRKRKGTVKTTSQVDEQIRLKAFQAWVLGKKA